MFVAQVSELRESILFCLLIVFSANGATVA